LLNLELKGKTFPLNVKSNVLVDSQFNARKIGDALSKIKFLFKKISSLSYNSFNFFLLQLETKSSSSVNRWRHINV